jgi:hypothetical protein
MSKLYKVFLALAAFAAFAVLPATASALNSATVVKVNPVTGTHEGPEPTGSEILGTGNHSAFSRLTDPAGNVILSCTTNELTGKLTRNDHTQVAGEITAFNFKGKTGVTPHTTHCTGSSGDVTVTPLELPYTLQINAAETTDHFIVRGGKPTEAAKLIKFRIQQTTIFGTITADYQATAALTGTYETTTTPKFTVEKAKFLETTNTIAPNEVFLDLQLQLHTHNPAGPITIVKAT